MRKNCVKIASIILAASLVAGCGSTSAELTKTDAVSSSLEEIVTVASVSKQNASNPNSTVYVVTGAEGDVEKVFDDNDSSIPVDIKITYTLNGEPISPKKLAGKSGHVTIRFDYTNNSFENVELNGESKKIYVPFTMVSGLLLDDEHFSNVNITNGKLIDDGNRTIALGLAFPGLKENLSLEDYDINVTVPEYVEISADVTDFSLDMTLSIATNEVFSEIETDDINTVDDLKEDLNKLTDAMEEILDGSAKLYDGLDTLYGKVGELTDGVTKLNDGAKELADGAKKVADGAGELAGGANKLSDGAGTLTNGAKELSDGLATLAANNDTLNGAAKQVFDTLLATASTQLKASGFDVTLTIDNYGDVLAGIANQLDPDNAYSMALNIVSGKVDENSAAIEAGVTANVRQGVVNNVTASVRNGAKENIEANYGAAIMAGAKGGVLGAIPMTEEVYDALDDESKAPIDQAINEAYNAEVEKQVEAYMASDAGQEAVNTNVDAYMASEEGQALVAQNVAAYKQNLINENMQSAEVQTQLAAASEGLKQIVGLKTSLDSYNQFYVGLKTYTAGVAKASEGSKTLYSGSVTLKDGANTLAGGAKTLAEGANTLSKGANELRDGVKTLNDSMPALTDGVTQLRDGAKALDEGLNLFNEDGIQKLSSVVTDDVETMIDRFKATVDVSKNYKRTSGNDENSSIKFIFRSEAID